MIFTETKTIKFALSFNIVLRYFHRWIMYKLKIHGIVLSSGVTTDVRARLLVINNPNSE